MLTETTTKLLKTDRAKSIGLAVVAYLFFFSSHNASFYDSLKPYLISSPLNALPPIHRFCVKRIISGAFAFNRLWADAE